MLEGFFLIPSTLNFWRFKRKKEDNYVYYCAGTEQEF
jgi:hypothetical protein